MRGLPGTDDSMTLSPRARPWKPLPLRDRVATWTGTNGGDDAPPLDAVLLCTRGRPALATDALHMLAANTATPLWGIPSTPADVPDTPLGWRYEYVNDHSAFLALYAQLQTPRTRIARDFCGDWDLPAKRLFAVWFSRANHMEKILLIDDDIRGVSRSVLASVEAALVEYPVVGALADSFLDTSVVGHASNGAGATRTPFLSGNCLALDLRRVCPLFAPVYNEDWLAVLDAVADRRAAAVTGVLHLPHDPYQDPLVPYFQEPGEVFVDTMYETLGVAASMDSAFWRSQLQSRRAWLVGLRRAARRRPRVLRSIAAALNGLDALRPDDFVDFAAAWCADVETWHHALGFIDEDAPPDLAERPTAPIPRP